MAIHRQFNIGIKSIITNSTGEILLLYRVQNGEGYWDIPGGRMEVGEATNDTLRRELKEDTGITEIISSSFFHAIVTDVEIPTDTGKISLALFIYQVEVPDTTKINLSSEHQKYEWFSPEKAAEIFSSKFPSDFIAKINQLSQPRSQS